ncbi:MAG: hypothetical protein LBL26_09915, partial [Peptococcaceae bacterium]|nr:hypothetical protein [Peptococcaceae bacterium]
AESANAAGLCIAKLRVAGLNDAARGARLNMIAAEPAGEALDPSMTEERGPKPNAGVNPVKDRAAAGLSEKAGKAGNTADPGSLRLNTSAVKGRAAGLSAESANAAGLCIAGLRAAGLNDAVSGVGLSMTEAELAGEALDPPMTQERGPRLNAGVNPVKDRAASGLSENAANIADPDNRRLNTSVVKGYTAAGSSEKAGKAGNAADPGSLRLNTSAVKGRAAGLSAESANAAGLCIAGLRAAGLNGAARHAGLNVVAAEPAGEASDPPMTQERGARPNAGVNPVKDRVNPGITGLSENTANIADSGNRKLNTPVVRGRAAAGSSENAGKAGNAGNTADPGSLRLNTSAVKGRAAGLSAESANAAGLCIAKLRVAGLNGAARHAGLNVTAAEQPGEALNPSMTGWNRAGLSAAAVEPNAADGADAWPGLGGDGPRRQPGNRICPGPGESPRENAGKRNRQPQNRVHIDDGVSIQLMVTDDRANKPLIFLFFQKNQTQRRKQEPPDFLIGKRQAESKQFFRRLKIFPDRFHRGGGV